jgi:hypothetical protein
VKISPKNRPPNKPEISSWSNIYAFHDFLHLYNRYDS